MAPAGPNGTSPGTDATALAYIPSMGPPSVPRRHRGPRPAGLAVVVTATILLSACGSTSSSHAAATSTSPASPSAALGLSLSLTPFTTVPGGPLAMAAPADGSARLLVAAQDGKVWVVGRDGTVAQDPMLDLGRRITSGGEQGLLGIAAHPRFPDDPRVFVDFSDTNGDTVVASFRAVPGDARRLDPDSFQQVLFVDQPYPNHNGGALAFGPDGDLYVSLGDGGSGGDPEGNGQRLDTLLGKVLRLGVDGSEPYTIPPGNPYGGGGGKPEIWLSGLRNPWRMSFDRETGDLWIGDVGQSAWEEVDVARKGVGGLNFGWRVMEGTHCYAADSCQREGLTMPATDYGREQGCTVIGGYVYRGAASPFAQGTYLFADYCSGNLFARDSTAPGYAPPQPVGNGGSGIAAWGQDADGELYVLALNGTISKVVATRR